MKAILSRALLGLALAAFTLGASAQQAKNPEIGTWKLNVEKSKYNPGPPPKSSTVVMEAAGDAVKYSSKGVNAEGKPTSNDYTAKYDGKDVPLAGSQIADTVSLKRVNEWTVERTDKKAGKVVQTVVREYSKDGKTFTAKVKGINVKGEPTDHVLLWERM